MRQLHDGPPTYEQQAACHVGAGTHPGEGYRWWTNASPEDVAGYMRKYPDAVLVDMAFAENGVRVEKYKSLWRPVPEGAIQPMTPRLHRMRDKAEEMYEALGQIIADRDLAHKRDVAWSHTMMVTVERIEALLAEIRGES